MHFIPKTLLIFGGCGFGGLMRYWISNATYLLVSKDFPYGTLLVNVSGSLAIGILFELFLGKFSAHGAELRLLLIVGFLGGYTTFSSFSMETINLLENAKFIAAGLNVLASVVLCLGAAWLGVVIGRQL